MKKVLFFLSLFSACIAFGQATTNQSLGTVNNSITNPIGGQPDEVFRFRTGSVRQLDAGSNFTFNNSRWFALGRVNTGSQTVYGLRFQLPNKAALFGYQDINDTNPRLQWVGTGANLGDLEFRVADSFTSTTSDLVATMTSEGNTVFGRVRSLGAFQILAKVEIDNVVADARFPTVGLKINPDPISTGNSSVGIDITSNTGVLFNTGGTIQTSGNNSTGLNINTTRTNRGVGINLSTSGNDSSVGVRSRVNSGSNEKIGVFGSTFLAGAFDAAIYGEVRFGGSNSFAGYFDGNVFTTGSYLPSDLKLKEDVNEELNALDRLSLLRPVTYSYKKMDQMSLPDQKQHGFISQEFAEVFPELTLDITKPVFDEEGKTISNYAFKAINYTGMISVLTSAVNELNNEVQTLKEEIASLQKENPSSDSSMGSPEKIILEQNRPNPFTDQTTIRYQLPEDMSKTSLMIFNLTGDIVEEIPLKENKGQITITASEIGKGMFIYSLVNSGEVLATKKMVIK